MTNRIDTLRDAFPELSDEQARSILVMMYHTATRRFNLTGDELQEHLDHKVKEITESSIERIGELLELFNRIATK